jgi:outer membrane immunogenic protein
MARAAFLAALLLAPPAFAADWLPPTSKGLDWSGAYVGAYGGLGISSGKATLHDFAGNLIPRDVEYGLFPRSISQFRANGAAGVSAGFNVQHGSFVGGIEGDIGHAWTKSNHIYSRIDTVPGSPFPGVSTNTYYETDFGAIGTLRARGGVAFGDTLLFGTAGIAAGQVENRVILALPEIGYKSPDWSASDLRLGYAVGVGAEHKLADNISIKFETLYLNLADTVVEGADPVSFAGEELDYRFSNDLIMPRLGLSIKF